MTIFSRSIPSYPSPTIDATADCPSTVDFGSVKTVGDALGVCAYAT